MQALLSPYMELKPMAIIDNRGRKSAAILTERDCTKRVIERTKLYDKKCRGLYVSIIPAGVATLSVKVTDPATHKQRSRLLGIHSPAFTVEDARTVVYALRNRMGQGENIAHTLRQDKDLKAKQGVTVDQVIAERGNTRHPASTESGPSNCGASLGMSVLRRPLPWSICRVRDPGMGGLVQ